MLTPFLCFAGGFLFGFLVCAIFASGDRIDIDDTDEQGA